MTETLTIVIFILTYATIAVQKIPFIKIDRPSGVLAGSTLLILAGSITLTEAYTLISWDVITFLMGMMIITAYLEYAGFFPLAARYIIKLAKTGDQLLILVILSTALLSALFVNDTVCLLFTPVLLAATKELKINPVPFLLAVAFSSNAGSALTITGNPQNMYIGIMSGMPFLQFIMYTVLPVLVSLLVIYIVLRLFYRKDMGVFTAAASVGDLLFDRTLIIKSLITLTLVLTLFIFHVEYPLAALIGATVIILTGRVTPRITLARVDWQLLIFFAGLFVVMGALQKTSLMLGMLDWMAGFMGGSEAKGLVATGGVTLALSNIVSNLPAVMMIYPVLVHLGLPDTFAVYLALISTFAGNLTIVGSVANIIVVERARAYGIDISFMTYFKAGLVVTLASVVFASLYMLIL